MVTIDKLQARALQALYVARARVADAHQERERGDVPGWVLITIMTAGMVTVLWTVAQDTLTGMFSDAVSKVTGGGAD